MSKSIASRAAFHVYCACFSDMGRCALCVPPPSVPSAAIAVHCPPLSAQVYCTRKARPVSQRPRELGQSRLGGGLLIEPQEGCYPVGQKDRTLVSFGAGRVSTATRTACRSGGAFWATQHLAGLHILGPNYNSNFVGVFARLGLNGPNAPSRWVSPNTNFFLRKTGSEVHVSNC